MTVKVRGMKIPVGKQTYLLQSLLTCAMRTQRRYDTLKHFYFQIVLCVTTIPTPQIEFFDVGAL